MQLWKPDAVEWVDQPGYSRQVASVLDTAFSQLNGIASVQLRILPFYDRLVCLSRQRMSGEQRVRLFLLLGLACLTHGSQAIPEAVRWLESAIDLADRRDDATALPPLFYHLGIAESWRSAFCSASDDFRACLGALYRLQAEDSRLDLALEQAAYARLATAEFYQAHYDTAATWFDHAEALARLAPERPLEMAAVQWGRALLLRWQQRPQKALGYAVAARESFGDSGDGSSEGRLLSVIAEISLDLAGFYASQQQMQRAEHFSDLALSSAAPALSLTRAAGDVAGMHLAELALARCAAAMQRNEDREGTISGVLTYGERQQDTALRIQALTALGRECACQGQQERARNCFGAAVDAGIGTSVSALSAWAYRALCGVPIH